MTGVPSRNNRRRAGTEGEGADSDCPFYSYDDADQLTSQYTPDSDGDGCTDAQEFAGAGGSAPGATGSYNPNSNYGGSPNVLGDLFDVPVPALTPSNTTGTRNRAATLGDASAILVYVGTTAANPNTPNSNGVTYGSDLNNNGVQDGREYDRAPSGNPNPPSEAAAPNGVVSLSDASVATAQVGRSCTQNPGSTSRSYDNNGNQTDGTTLAYDAENRLTSSSNGSWTYAYNGDGLRTSRSSGGGGRTFVWNVSGTLPEIIKDSGGNQYVYGLDLISRTDSNNVQEYYLTDGLGSTTGAADGTGAVGTSYQYDAFGALRSQVGSSTNEFTFTGEQVDSNGLQYLRARYYDRTTGRFLTQDPLYVSDRYQYAASNPSNLAGPSGLFPCPGCKRAKRIGKAAVERAGEAVRRAEDVTRQITSATVTGAAAVGKDAANFMARFATLNCASFGISALAIGAEVGLGPESTFAVELAARSARRAILLRRGVQGVHIAALGFTEVSDIIQFDFKEGWSFNNITDVSGAAAAGVALATTLRPSSTLETESSALSLGISGVQCLHDVIS